MNVRAPLKHSSSKKGSSLGLRLGTIILGAAAITLCSILLVQDRFPAVGLRHRPQGNCRIGADGRIACHADEQSDPADTKEGFEGGRSSRRLPWGRGAASVTKTNDGTSNQGEGLNSFKEFAFDFAAPVETTCFKIDGSPCPEEEAKRAPPPETMATRNLSLSDMILLRKASGVEGAFLPATIATLVEPAVLGVKALADQVQAVKDENGRYNTPEMPRLAFLFITRGPMPLAPLWEGFLDGYEELSSIYVHADPDFRPPLADEDPTYSRLFAENLIPSEKVRWGDPSMVDAERRLLAHALLKPTNMRFLLLSESCMPLHSFPYIYAYLMGSNQSFLHSACAQGWNCAGRYSPNMWPTVDRLQWRKGSQWWALTREHAALAVQDRAVYPVLAQWCKADDWHRHCYVDEFYFQVLLQIKGEKGVAGRGPTWAAWAGEAHPITYGPEQLTPEFLRDLKGQMCSWNQKLQESCFLVVRKIPAAALKTALSISQDSLGF